MDRARLGRMDRMHDTLAMLLAEHPAAQIRFSCSSCRTSHDVAAASVLTRLEGRGLGDDRLDVRELGRFSERPCYRCGESRWETRARVPA